MVGLAAKKVGELETTAVAFDDEIQREVVTSMLRPQQLSP